MVGRFLADRRKMGLDVKEQIYLFIYLFIFQKNALTTIIQVQVTKTKRNIWQLDEI
jgi:hypothetical protein